MTEKDNLAEFAERIRLLLHADGICLSDDQVAQLQRHVDLVREWNPIVSVVSAGDLKCLWERHVADSLSLGAVIQRLGCGEATLLDIGSGGGFPAIPTKVMLPSLAVTLVERSEKKAGFLRKVVGALGLSGVTILAGEYPRVAEPVRPDVITARAVENPERLTKQIAARLGERAVYLCQSGVTLGEGYVSECVVDPWTEAGLRRGTLEIVRRSPTA